MIQKKQTSLPIIAGVLLLVSAGSKLLMLIGVLAAGFFVAMPVHYNNNAGVLLILLVLLPLAAIIAMSIAGGIFSLLRKRWGLVLAGSILAILPFSVIGIAATVLVAISRDEFEGT